MHDVSNAINILDPNKDAIDKAICGSKWAQGGASNTAATETAGKCNSGSKVHNKPDSYSKLSDMFEGAAADGGNSLRSYPEDAASKMGDHTSATISKDTAALNREQKGVVSSAFAKAHDIHHGCISITKKNMHDVSNAINILDDKIQAKICKQVDASGTTAGKCHATNDKTGLLQVFGSENEAAYKTKEHEKVGIHTSATISKETSTNLNRGEKGVVSSAFAKAHEGG